MPNATTTTTTPPAAAGTDKAAPQAPAVGLPTMQNWMNNSEEAIKLAHGPADLRLEDGTVLKAMERPRCYHPPINLADLPTVKIIPNKLHNTEESKADSKKNKNAKPHK